MKFKVGQIVFFKNNGFFGTAIGLRNIVVHGRNDTTHVGMITKVTGNDVLIHEALSKGFTPNWYSKTGLLDGIMCGNVHVGKINYKLSNVYENAEKYVGIPYGFLDVGAIILTFIFNFKFIKLTGAKQLICSEAIARLVYDSSNKNIDFQAEYGKIFDLIDPEEIFLSQQVTILKFTLSPLE